jgi:uncharacterized membrane protein YfcA
VTLLSPAQWAWAIAAIGFAAVLRGFTGFGFAVAAVPLASLVLPPAVTVAAALCMQTAIGLRDCIAERHRADWRSVRWLIGGAVAGTPVGLALLTWLPTAWVRLGLGLMVLATVAITSRPAGRPVPPDRRLGLAIGVASGVSNGLAAMAGPPAIAYFLATRVERDVMRSSLMALFPIVSALALPPAAWAGLITSDALLLALLGLPLMIGGGWLGTRLFRRHGARGYRPVAIMALGATAAAAILRGLAGLLG